MGGRHWTDEEISYIRESWGVKNIKTICNHLHRSRKAVEGKACRIDLSSVYDGTVDIPVGDLVFLTGKPLTTIQHTWIQRNALPCKKVSWKVRTVSEKDLAKFMEEHPHLWKACECDFNSFQRYPWFREKLYSEKMGTDSTNYRRSWTDYENARLLSLCQRGKTYKEIGEELGRTPKAVGKHYEEIAPNRVKRCRRWSNEENSKLIELRAQGLTYKEIGEQLGRSPKAISTHYQEIGGKNNG